MTSESSELVRFSITAPADLLKAFDEFVDMRGNSVNRSEAIRDLIRDELYDQSWATPGAQVAGTLTLLYQHHMTGITGAKDAIEHEAGHVIISKMHVHLDSDFCLETIALKGEAVTVQKLANKLIGLKGVKNGHLTAVALNAAGVSDSYAHTHEHTHEGEQDGTFAHTHAHEHMYGHVHDHALHHHDHGGHTH